MVKFIIECVIFLFIVSQIFLLSHKLKGNSAAESAAVTASATMIAGAPVAPVSIQEVTTDGFVPMRPLPVPEQKTAAEFPVNTIGQAISQQATHIMNPGALQKQAEIEAQRIIQSGDMKGFAKKLEQSGLISPSSSED